MKKSTQEEFIKRLDKYYKKYNYDYSVLKYVDSNTPILLICNDHGDFKVTPYKLFKNELPICKVCRKDLIGFRVNDTKSFIKKASILHDNKYDYSLSNYINNKSNIKIKCKDHGVFELKADEHLSSLRRCPSCKSRHSLNQNDVLDRFNKIHNNKYEYPNFKFNTVHNYIDVKCQKHGIFSQKIMIHLNGHGCMECGKDSLRKDTKSFVERSIEIHNGKYDYTNSIYKHSQEKLEIKCPEHGIFSQIARDHLHGNGCWACAVENREFISSYEIEIIDWIKEKNLGIKIKPSFHLGRKEIDIYFPDLKWGIEFNGVYWHSHLNKPKEYHQIKSDYFKTHNINIFHIWEYQWCNPEKKEIIKSMILNKLNHTKNKIFARKCVIKEISSPDYREFCNNNHIQGHSPSKIKLGLYYNDELVACMGFGNLRVNLGNKIKKENHYELIRYCTLLNNNILGGASKLLKHFERNYTPKYLVSYADGDYSQGNLYNILGFKNEGFTNISYSYYNPKDGTLKNRFNYRKSELIKMGYDKNKTEFEITHEMGLYRLYNSGTYKFIKEYK